MAEQLFSNLGRTQLATSLLIGGISATVQDGSVFSSPGTDEFELLTISPQALAFGVLSVSDIEIIKLTARSGNTLSTIERAQEGTTAKAWLANDWVISTNTDGSMSRLLQKPFAQANLQTGAFDLAATADDVDTIAIESGYRFFATEISLIIVTSTAVTVDPNIAVGTTSGGTDLLASTTQTETNLHDFNANTPASRNGVTGTIYVSVKTGATATALTGAVMISGFLREE